MMDPPDSLRYRRLLNPFFAPSAAERREKVIRDLVTGLIDRFIDSGTADLQAQLAKPLTAMFTMQLVGLPVEDWRVFAEPVHESIHEGTGYGTDKALDDKAATILSIAARRRVTPADDLLSHLANARLDGRPLEPDEVVAITFLTIIGGVETTASLSSSAFVHLGRDRELRRRLIEDPSLIPGAVEELLRYYTPVQTNSRLVATPTELEGQSLQPGDVVLMCWASANRDEREFPDADRFLVDRPVNRHVAFAVGTHRCLGSHFARAELRVLLEEVLRGIPDYELDEAGIRLYPDVGDVYGYAAVPVTFPVPERV
jgi:cytochrome P450